jgi:adenylate kinase family enzyme
MRLAILGNSGSGKSTLARQLAALQDLEPLDLDTLAWEPGQIAVPRDPAAALADVAALCPARQAWVIEGCYADLIGATLPTWPILVFLEPGLATCLAHCRARPWEPHKYPSKTEQDEKLAFLLTWVKAYYTREGPMSLRAHQALFEVYEGPKRKLTAPPGPEAIKILQNLGART